MDVDQLTKRRRHNVATLGSVQSNCLWLVHTARHLQHILPSANPLLPMKIYNKLKCLYIMEILKFGMPLAKTERSVFLMVCECLHHPAGERHS
jgi:hypothetical protein